MLGADSREDWDSKVLDDPRVVHFWDQRARTGRWFGDHVAGRGLAWDAFFLYGPDATWVETPEPLASTGRTIIHQHEKLKADLGRLP